MYSIFDKDNVFSYVPDSDFKVFNALLYILSNKRHNGTFTIIEVDKENELRRNYFYHYDGYMEYDRSIVNEDDESRVEMIEQDEIINLIQKTVLNYSCIGDVDSKADYYFVVNRYEDVNPEICGFQANVFSNLIKEGKF